MRIAILQPTFLPWLGWFDIVDQVDMLIMLDDVAFDKRSWQQRNRLRTAHQLEYVTVPVRSAGRSGQPILDVEISDPRFAVKLERTITGSYARTPYYESLFPAFCQILWEFSSTGLLSKLNLGLLGWFFSTLGILTPWQVSSRLNVAGKRGEYMAALCEALGADDYLSPMGAEAYLLEDRHAFDKRHIKVWLHEYVHPEYRQVFQPFIPYASTLDLIFNEGPRALDIIRSGRRQPLALGTFHGLNYARVQS